jgi:hypothetical protein
MLGVVNAAEPDAGGGAAASATTVVAQQVNHDTRFGRYLSLQSSNANGTSSGVVDTLLDFPFSVASAELSKAASWCDILILHYNVKSCRPIEDSEGTWLDVAIGRKRDDPGAKVYRARFAFNIVHQRDDLLRVTLVAQNGPLGTSNYRIVLQARPETAGKSALRFSYAYDYGMLGKVAMQAYLRTLGRDKVGFSIEGKDAQGQPRYVGGMRGAVERNAMRYCFAVESFLRSLSQPGPERVEARLHDWFDAVERYPRQLREMGRDEYLEMKRSQIVRQRAVAPVAVGG